MRLIVVGAFAAIVALLFVISAQATPTTEWTTDERTGDELYRPYSTGTLCMVQSGYIGKIGFDNFNGQYLSSQWDTTINIGTVVDVTPSIGLTGGQLEVRSASGPSDSQAYIHQDARWPNNHTIEFRYGGDRWGAFGSKSNTSYYGVYVETVTTTMRIRYLSTALTNEIVTTANMGTHGYNWSVSIERDAANYHVYCLSLDTAYAFNAVIARGNVYDDVNQSTIAIGDFGPPSGGNSGFNCFFDNYSMSNRPTTGDLNFFQYNPYGSSISYVNFTGNLNKTYVWARAANNYSALIAASYANITGAIAADNSTLNCTLATNLTGSTIQFQVWFNYSDAYIDGIYFAGQQRNQTYNLTVGTAHFYEDVYDAVNGTVHGDEVYVTIGDYENDIIYSFTNITVIGEDNELSLLRYSSASVQWSIINTRYQIEFRNLNFTTPNVGIYRGGGAYYDNSTLTVTNCRFYDAYYPIYTRYTNVTVENSYFDYNYTPPTPIAYTNTPPASPAVGATYYLANKPTGVWNPYGDDRYAYHYATWNGTAWYFENPGVTKKAIRVHNGNLIAKNNTFYRYWHAIYADSANGLAEYNTIHGIRSTVRSIYDDAGGIVWYPWRVNGTTILRHNYINGASWGISMEETDICHIYQNRIIGCDIGISVVQRDPPNYWRPSIRGYGGINYIHNNTLENNMKANGFNLYGHQIVFMDSNTIRNATATVVARPAIYVYHTNPNADIDNTGIYYLNNTLIENCGVGLSTRSLGTGAYATMAIHVNNMSIASHSTIGMAVLQCNRSSTFENITIRQQTFGTSGPGFGGIFIQAPIDGTFKNIHISNFSYGITIQGYNPLRFENITIDNCHYGIDYYPTHAHISWFEAHRLPTVADDLFFDIDTSGCTFDVRSTFADAGLYAYEDNAYINITGGNLGTSIDLFTAGSKRINVGTYAWLNSPAGTFTITHNAAPVATANATGSDQRFNLPKYSSYNNITVDEQCVVTVGNLEPEQAGNFDVYRNGVSGYPLTRTADSITFNAEGGNTYEMRVVTPLTPVWELMDDTSKMITLNIGQLIAATIAIAMFAIVSMFLVIIIAGGGRGMRRGYSGGRSRWR